METTLCECCLRVFGEDGAFLVLTGVALCAEMLWMEVDVRESTANLQSKTK